MNRNRRALMVIGALLLVGLPARGSSQSTDDGVPPSQIVDLQNQVTRLSADVSRLESDLRSAERDWQGGAAGGLALFLTATFCSVWARRRDRGPIMWFFAGLFFHFFALAFLLYLDAGYPPDPPPYRAA